MNIDYNLYKIFLYLYEEKSISKTANKLYVSQPAISYSLKELESQLGYSLFHRNSKGIEPTEEAKELYRYISTAFHILRDAEDHMQNVNELKIGTIRIGIASVGKEYIIDKVQEFKNKYPGIHIEFLKESREECIKQLETKEIDFLMDSTSVKENQKYQKRKLKKCKLGLVYHKRNYKGKLKNISDLEKHPCIFPTKNTEVRTLLEEYFKKNHLEIQPIMESNDEELLLEFVRRGLGIGFLTKEMIQRQLDQDEFVFIEDDTFPKIEIGIIYMEEYLSKAAKKLVKLWEQKE